MGVNGPATHLDDAVPLVALVLSPVAEWEEGEEGLERAARHEPAHGVRMCIMAGVSSAQLTNPCIMGPRQASAHLWRSVGDEPVK